MADKRRRLDLLDTSIAGDELTLRL